MQHIDEGTIHAWLDAALPAAEAALVERHVSECTSCAAAVAEARGLIAASSRILNALDDVPGGVIPGRPDEVSDPLAALRARRAAEHGAAARPHRLPRTYLAAAGIAFLALGSAAVVWRSGFRVTEMADRGPAPAAERAPLPSPAPQASTPGEPSTAINPLPVPGPGSSALRQGRTAVREEQAVAGDRPTSGKPVAQTATAKATERDARQEAVRANSAADLASRAAAVSPQKVSPAGDSGLLRSSRLGLQSAASRETFPAAPAPPGNLVTSLAGCYQLAVPGDAAVPGGIPARVRLAPDHAPAGADSGWYHAEAVITGEAPATPAVTMRWQPGVDGLVLLEAWPASGVADAVPSRLRLQAGPATMLAPPRAAGASSGGRMVHAERVACPR